MFPITRTPRVSLDALLHFLMKRVNGLDYQNLMFMPISKRDSFFHEEYAVYEKEVAEAKK